MNHAPRPDLCCGVCPPTVSGGYDCTCMDNPRCPKHLEATISQYRKDRELRTYLAADLPHPSPEPTDAQVEVMAREMWMRAHVTDWLTAPTYLKTKERAAARRILTQALKEH